MKGKQMTKTMIRQGDVLVMPVAALPETKAAVAPENGRLILARGEATGHHHSFAFSDRVTLFREDGSGGGLFLLVTDAHAVLEHQEHSALTLPPGNYAVRIQRTFAAGMVQQVAD
jgi:hypothetical protein